MAHGRTIDGANGPAEPERRGAGEPAARLRAEIGAAAYERYFGVGVAGRTAVRAEDGRLCVRVPTRFAGRLIEDRLGETLARVADASGLTETLIEVAEPRCSSTPGRGGSAGDVSNDASNDAGRSASEHSAGDGAPRTSSSAGGTPRTSARTEPRPRAGAAPDPRARFGAGARVGSGAGAGAGAGTARLRRLDDFVVGSSNRSAFAAASRMGDASAAPGFGPLVLYGPCGVGKTHLLQGVAARFEETAAAHGVRGVVRSTTAEAFTSGYIEAVRAGKVAAFQRSLRRVSLLCIDDIHFLARKEGTQRELLHTFDALDLSGARIVLVSDEHPRDLRALSEPLVSRFVGGVVVEVGAPDDDLCERLAAHLASQRGLTLAPGAGKAVVTWVRAAAGSRGAARSYASARDLAGAVSRLRAMAGIHPELLGPGGSVGSVMVDAALSGSGNGGAVTAGTGRGGGRRRVAIREIVEASAAATGVSVSELMGRGRHKRVVLARSVASYLSRELTSHSASEIAVKLGRPNHSTVVTASRRVATMIEAGAAVDVGCDSDGLAVSDFVAAVRRRLTAGG